MYLVCKQGPHLLSHEDASAIQQDHPMISCGNCHAFITQPSFQIQIQGAFCHTFANPHGQVFEIGCFDDAPGCMPASPPSSEFPWFKGYHWKIGVCRGCGTHLGWVFGSDQHLFFGLILEKLIFP